MSTYMANSQTVERKWYIIDAAGKSMGRVAAQAAAILNGKHKVTFTPHVDCGDYVIILNSEKAVLTGKKLTQKYYRTHSGYAGGLKETQYRVLMQSKPNLAMQLAVKGMLPKNSLGRHSLGRLKVFVGNEHTHVAQNPTVWAE